MDVEMNIKSFKDTRSKVLREINSLLFSSLLLTPVFAVGGEEKTEEQDFTSIFLNKPHLVQQKDRVAVVPM